MLHRTWRRIAAALFVPAAALVIMPCAAPGQHAVPGLPTGEAFTIMCRPQTDKHGFGIRVPGLVGANDIIDAFHFTQQPRAPVILEGAGSAYPPAPQVLAHAAGPLATTNSAYGTYAMAADTIASIYGSGLAPAAAPAASLPAPGRIRRRGGVSVKVIDAAGTASRLSR